MKTYSRVLLRSILLALLGLTLLGSVASAASQVDQQQPVTDITAGNLAIGGQSSQILAQVVTAGVTGKLIEVRFPVSCAGANSLTIEVQQVANGKPNGVVLTSHSFDGATLPVDASSPYFKRFVFKKHVKVTAGAQFAIVLRPDSSGLCSVKQGPAGNPYPGGDGYYDARPNQAGVWVSISNGTGRYDLPFQTVVQPTGRRE